MPCDLEQKSKGQGHNSVEVIKRTIKYALGTTTLEAIHKQAKMNISTCSLKCEVKVTIFCVGQVELVNVYKLTKFHLCTLNGLRGTKLNANCWDRTDRWFSPIHRCDLLCNPVEKLSNSEQLWPRQAIRIIYSLTFISVPTLKSTR